MKPFVLVRLYSHFGEEQPSIERFNVSGFPTMVILGSDGREIDRIMGYTKPKRIAAHIREILSGDTFNRWVADYRSRSEHSSVEIEECLGKLTNHGLYQQVLAVAAREPLYKLSEAARALVYSARPKAFANVYEEVAEKARSTGWTKLELPPDPAGIIGVDLKNLALPGNQGRLKTKEAFRTALREARSADADRMLRAISENAGNWSAKRDLLWLAEKNGCKGTVIFLVESVSCQGVDRLEHREQIYEILRALIGVGGRPDLAGLLADRLLQLSSNTGDFILAAEAKYFAGYPKPAVEDIRKAQRKCLDQGLLPNVHVLGKEGREMAEGRWSPLKPWIEYWPKP